MKVLQINIEHSYGGGANTVYFNTGKMLSRKGIDVIYFSLHSSKELPCSQSVYFAKRICQSKPISFYFKRLYNRDAAQSLQRLINDEHPDIAQTHLIWGGLAPSIFRVLKNNGIPIVHTVHDYAMICSKVTLRGMDGEVCEKCSGGHYCNSIRHKCHKNSYFRSILAAAEFWFHNRFFHPTAYINHFMYVSHFCSEKHSEMDMRFRNVSSSVLYNVPDERVVLISNLTPHDAYSGYYLYYGRLSYEKGLKTLIYSFAERANLRLKIVGTGPLELELKSICKRLSINNVEFEGFKTGDELYKFVLNAKFVCVPSEWYENNPMTIIESYTLGTPVIAARIGGIPEIVEDFETGFLFESGSSKSLLKVLDSCENMPIEKYSLMRGACKDFASRRFEREKYVERLVALYNNLITNY